MAGCTLEFLASAYDSERVDAAKGDNTKKPKVMVRQCRAGAAQAKARYKSWSAEWKAIESAIARFCTELELTVDQLFALTEVRPRAIEEARGILDADAAANRAMRKGIYDQLRQAWFGDAKPKGEAHRRLKAQETTKQFHAGGALGGYRRTVVVTVTDQEMRDGSAD